MTLREKQSIFLSLTHELIGYALSLKGYALTYGETWRPKSQAAEYASKGVGIKNSLHNLKLAIDLNLFINGEYQESSEAHRILGEYWKKLHPLCRWGGDFKDKNGKPDPDGNHYSLEHEGVK